jgi:hypothetical protein
MDNTINAIAINIIKAAIATISLASFSQCKGFNSN